MKEMLTIENLKQEAKIFAELESQHWESSIYGITDGKAVGTYFERKFKTYLSDRYVFDSGNSANVGLIYQVLI